jgi:ribose transport system substrate-binding protein
LKRSEAPEAKWPFSIFKQAESCRLRVKGFREVIEEHNSKAPAKIDLVLELDGGGAKG